MKISDVEWKTKFYKAGYFNTPTTKETSPSFYCTMGRYGNYGQMISHNDKSDTEFAKGLVLGMINKAIEIDG